MITLRTLRILGLSGLMLGATVCGWPHASGAWAAALPVPPVPPSQPPADEAAPVPNPDLREPVRLSSSEVTVRPQFYRADRPDMSQGFTPGSRFQTNDERKPLQTPGLRITVPLQLMPDRR